MMPHRSVLRSNFNSGVEMEIPLREGSGFYGADRGGGGAKPKSRLYRPFPLRIAGGQDEEDCQVIARQAAIKLLHLRDTNSQDLRKLVMLRGLLQTTSLVQDYHQTSGIKFRKRRSKIPTRLVKNLVSKPCKDVKAWWNHHENDLDSRPNGETCDSRLRRQRGRREGENPVEVSVPPWRDIYQDIENRATGGERMYELPVVCEEDRPKESPRRGICTPVRHPPSRRAELDDNRFEGPYLSFKEVTPNTYITQQPTGNKKGKSRSAGSSPRKEEPLPSRPATGVGRRVQEDKKKEDRNNFLKKGKGSKENEPRNPPPGKKKPYRSECAPKKVNEKKTKQADEEENLLLQSPSKVKISLEKPDEAVLEDEGQLDLESESSQLLIDLSHSALNLESNQTLPEPVSKLGSNSENSNPQESSIIESIQDPEVETVDSEQQEAVTIEEESYYSVLEDSLPSLEDLENGDEDCTNILTPSLTELLTSSEILTPGTDDKFPDIIFCRPETVFEVYEISDDSEIETKTLVNNNSVESNSQKTENVIEES